MSKAADSGGWRVEGMGKKFTAGTVRAHWRVLDSFGNGMPDIGNAAMQVRCADHWAQGWGPAGTLPAQRV